MSEYRPASHTLNHGLGKVHGSLFVVNHTKEALKESARLIVSTKELNF